MLKPFYESRPSNLCEFVIPLTVRISEFLGFSTRFVRSSEMGTAGAKTERLVNITRAMSCSTYLSGPSAKAYLEESLFASSNVSLEYAVYDFPEYPQLHHDYDPSLSIIDLLFMAGSKASDYLGATRK